MLLLAATWVISAQRLQTQREILNRNSQAHQENLTIIISENFSHVLDRGRLLALTSAEWFDGSPKYTANRLSAMLSTDRSYLRIALYDRQQKRVYSSSPAIDNEQLTEAIRTGLKTTRSDKQPALWVGPLSSGVEKAWQVPLLFPVVSLGGEVRGLLLVVLDLGYLLRLYQEINIGPTGVIQILKSTGEEIARLGQGGLELSQTPWKTSNDALSQGVGGVLETDFFSHGQINLVNYRHFDNYPFIVVISREMEEILADSGLNASRYPPTLWLLTLIVLFATVLIINAIRQQQQLFSALKAADTDKRNLILQLEDEKHRAFKLAAHDALTGLPNRRMLYELGASHLSQAKRSRLHYGLMFIDLDRFKSINDTLGHHVGDLLLQTVAERLRSTLRESDVIARLGGDEFAVLLTGLDSVDDMALIASKLVEQISLPCNNLASHDIAVSPSIGIAIFPRDGHDVDTLSRHADAAMYQSKHAGRGRYTFYEATINPVSDRQFDLEQRLPQAIAEGELVLHFQPKVRLSNFEIVGFEALVRWQHPVHGLIYPDEFIPIAESTGLDVPLGDWVAQASCQQLANWQSEGLVPVPIAINISARQLHDEQLPHRITTYLAAHKITAGLLEVEITESCLVKSVDIASRVLNALERLGISIALDDFGNGYSSFAYLRTLPIHVIKIDRSFINDIRNKPDDAVIVASMVTLAHNLKKKVVAEGIELHEQLVHLKSVHCDVVQGYYLSRPVPSSEARQLLIQSFLIPQ